MNDRILEEAERLFETPQLAPTIGGCQAE